MTVHALRGLAVVLVVVLSAVPARPASRTLLRRSPLDAGTRSQAVGEPQRGPAGRADARLVSESAIGAVRLEMTLAELRRALPGAKFKRTSDGDGAALVEVTFSRNESVVVSADEADPAAPVAWSKAIKTIETFSPAFHTRAGVHPGSSVADVEKVYGKVARIELSEIESREFITFENQPAGLTFRLNYTGRFPPGMRTTTQFGPDAEIFSISISSYSRGAVPAPSRVLDRDRAAAAVRRPAVD
jgi:hypothetical protein